MDFSNWSVFYKYKQRAKIRSNLLYVPRISPDKKIYCQDYNIDKKYFFDRTSYTEEVRDFYFNNEVRWLEHFANESFAPEIIDIDRSKKLILFNWYDTSLNHLIENRTYKDKYNEQVKSILKKLESQNVYKINHYPHTCYIDANENIRIHDFYACGSSSNYYLPKEFLNPILGKMDIWRFGQFEKDGLINMKSVYEMSLKQNAGEWPFEL